jgi:hypothetical protein
MIETLGFLAFLLAILFVAMGPKPPKRDKPADQAAAGDAPIKESSSKVSAPTDSSPKDSSLK